MDDLILKYLQGKCSDQEKESLFDWVEQQDENKKHFRQMRQLWDLNHLAATPAESDKTEAAYSEVSSRIFEKGKERSNRFISVVLKYAAVAAVCFGISWYFWQSRQKTSGVVWQNVEVPVGQRVKLTLADGSLVWLNSKSKFSFPAGFSAASRMVKLNGEAYFEVAHNKRQPFIVQTAHAAVTVKGTRFNLYAYENEENVETTLLEGKVTFAENGAGKQSKDLEPHQQLIYNASKGDLKVWVNVKDQDVISWVSGVYFFNDVTIRDMIARLTHYYDVDVMVMDSTILDYTCIGKFRLDESLEDVLQVISTTKPFKYKIEGKRVIISSKKITKN